jgi:hypothetical protein
MTRIVLLACTLVMLTGCCTCRDRYKPALTQWSENLKELRPTMKAGADLLPGDLGQSKMDRYDATKNGIDRVAGEGPEVWGKKEETGE